MLDIFNLPRGYTGLVPGRWVGDYVSMWCVLLTCWVCRFTQATVKPAGREKSLAAFLKADTSRDWVQWGRM
jgi:hypothetical protein